MEYIVEVRYHGIHLGDEDFVIQGVWGFIEKKFGIIYDGDDTVLRSSVLDYNAYNALNSVNVWYKPEHSGIGLTISAIPTKHIIRYDKSKPRQKPKSKPSKPEPQGPPGPLL